MRILTELSLLSNRTLIQSLRNVAWVAMSITTPLLYLILFTPLLKDLAGGPGFSSNSVMDVFLPGVLTLMAFGAGIAVGWSTLFELRAGVIERLRVTPANRLALLGAPILANLLPSFVMMAVVVAIGAFLGFHIHWSGLVLMFVLFGLLQVVFSAFSVGMALIMKELNSFAALMNGINLPLVLLSGILLPMTLAPGWMVVIAHLNPMYYAVEAARLLAVGTLSNSKVWLGFAVMTALAILSISWATRVYRKAVA